MRNSIGLNQKMVFFLLIDKDLPSWADHYGRFCIISQPTSFFTSTLSKKIKPPSDGEIKTISDSISHEIGHLFGLEHSNPKDTEECIMQQSVSRSNIFCSKCKKTLIGLLNQTRYNIHLHKIRAKQVILLED